MHELSIALRLIDLATDHLARAGGGSPTAITVRLGRLAGVDGVALAAAYEIAAVDTPLQHAVLEIVDVPVSIWCAVCAREVELPGLVPLACPVCGTRSGDLRGGGELELESLGLAAAEAAS